MPTLYGRSRLLSQLFGELQKPCGKRYLLEGPSGIGKTAVVRILAGDLRARRPDQPTMCVEILSPAQAVDSVLSRLAVDLVEFLHRHEQPFNQLRTALNRFSWEYTGRLSLALLLDGASHLAPQLKETVAALGEQTIETLGAASMRAAAERIAKKGTGDSLMGFLTLMQCLSEQGLGGNILVDRLEAASESVRAAIHALACGPLGQSNILLSVNNEVPDGIVTLEDIWPDLNYRGTARLTLAPLGEKDLSEWLKREGRPVPEVEVLSRVIENCNGRPLFLRDWVEGLGGVAEGGNVLDRLEPYYLQRIAPLSNDARFLLTILSILPTRAAASFAFVRSLFPDQSAMVVVGILGDLTAANFLERLDNGEAHHRVVHEMTAQVLRRSLPGEAIAECASRALAAVSESNLRVDASDLAYVRARLAAYANDDEHVVALGVDAGQRLLGAGSVGAAAETFASVQRAADRLGREDIRSRASKGLARIHLHTGSYKRAIEEVAGLDHDPEALLLRARALVRLNRYGDARQVLQQMTALGEGGPDGSILQLLAEKERNTILRDLGEISEAVEHSAFLVKRARETEGVPPDVLAGSIRAQARSLALSGEMDEALALAEEALSLGLGLGSSKAVGGAMLARAEALRHGGNYAIAEESYEQAVRIGAETLNRDLELWAALGLANNSLLQGRPDRARETLHTHVAPIVANAEERHPIEYLHWRLSGIIIDSVVAESDQGEAESLLAAYAAMGIEWPRRYIEASDPNQGLEPIPF